MRGVNMTIGNAMKFIRSGMVDKDLRQRLNRAGSLERIETVLSEASLTFSNPEFEEAYYHLLTLCQFEEQAEQLNAFRLWWGMLSAGRG